jgi:hypothetical protein
MFDPGALGTLLIGLEANRRREQIASARTLRRARRGGIRARIVGAWRRALPTLAPAAERQARIPDLACDADPRR